MDKAYMSKQLNISQQLRDKLKSTKSSELKTSTYVAENVKINGIFRLLGYDTVWHG